MIELQYIRHGFNIFPVSAKKMPLWKWDRLKTDKVTETEVRQWFSTPNQLAIICGNVSGNLEVIDVDSKYDLTGTLFSDLIQDITDYDNNLASTLPIVRTRSGGYHIYYRCSEIEGNKKLAQRYTTDAEREINPKEKVKVLIETRGEGGYVLAPPSGGYELIQGSLFDLPIITPDQRNAILNICRAYNEVIPPKDIISRNRKSDDFFGSCFKDYNERGDVIPLLTSHGWTIVSQRGPRIILKRPGATSASSGNYNREMNLFSVFSTSTEFETEKGYRPAAVFAMLECNNDWKRAALKLKSLGYGRNDFSSVSMKMPINKAPVHDEPIRQQKKSFHFKSLSVEPPYPPSWDLPHVWTESDLRFRFQNWACDLQRAKETGDDALGQKICNQIEAAGFDGIPEDILKMYAPNLKPII